MNTNKTEDNETLKNRIVYSLPVRLGYWNEDLSLLEEKHRLAFQKQERCELTVQKLKTVYKNLLRGTVLAKQSAYIMYGNNYQLQACEIPNSMKGQQGSNTFYGLYLSGLISEYDIDEAQHFQHGFRLTASPNKAPLVRNTFVFVSCDSDRSNEPVFYGQDLFIRIYESGDLPLYVQCECHSIDTFGVHLTLKLSQVPDIYCRFKILHWQPSLRYETRDTAIPQDSRVIIQHTASGQNLAVEPSKWLATFFGAECFVSCHTFKDTHRMETAENMWKVVAAKTPNMNLFVRAAKGEDIPAALLE